MLHKTFKFYRGHFKAYNAAFKQENIITYFLVDIDEKYVGGLVLRNGVSTEFNHHYWPIPQSLGLRNRTFVSFSPSTLDLLQSLMSEISDTLHYKSYQFLDSSDNMLNADKNQRVLTFSKHMDGKTAEMICVPTVIITRAGLDLFDRFPPHSVWIMSNLGYMVMYEDPGYAGDFQLAYLDLENKSRLLRPAELETETELERFYSRVFLMNLLAENIENENFGQFDSSDSRKG